MQLRIRKGFSLLNEHDQEFNEPIVNPYATTTPPSSAGREMVEFVKMIVWFLVLFLALKTWVIEGYEVQGPSMEPTLLNDERILVLKLPHVLSKLPFLGGVDAIHPGDIIVFDSKDEANKRYVKRVIAEGPEASSNTVSASTQEGPPRDAVEIKIEEGRIFVNNQRKEEPYLPEEIRKEFHSNTTREFLGPGEYYVLGDNRPVSKDSRSFHAVDDQAIIGRAVFRFWPLSRISLLR
ncbi:MAG: signal peptidase I [Candidatus Hydrogenedentota bacterium]